MTDTKTDDTKLEIKYLKLVNGESIVVTSKDNFINYKSKKYIEISDPIEIKVIKAHNGYHVMEHYTMQPWIKMAISDKIVIPTESIMVALDLHDDAIIQYKEYVKDAIMQEVVLENEPEDEQNLLESEDESYGEDRKITRKIIH